MKENERCVCFGRTRTAETMKNIRCRSVIYAAKFSHEVVMMIGGMQMKMVHCISTGEETRKQMTQFVDGFQAAQQLKTQYPEQFRLLSTVKLDFFDVGHNAVMMSRHPTIKCVISTCTCIVVFCWSLAGTVVTTPTFSIAVKGSS